jgi:hypothetical protein
VAKPAPRKSSKACAGASTNAPARACRQVAAEDKAELEATTGIDASDVSVDMETADVDVALRYGPARSMPAHAIRLFGEQLTPAASPWLLKSEAKINSPADFESFTLIEAGDAHSTHLEWLSWRRWFNRQAEGSRATCKWQSGRNLAAAAHGFPHGLLAHPLPAPTLHQYSPPRSHRLLQLAQSPRDTPPDRRSASRIAPFAVSAETVCPRCVTRI